jgi:hypothetical protein
MGHLTWWSNGLARMRGRNRGVPDVLAQLIRPLDAMVRMVRAPPPRPSVYLESSGGLVRAGPILGRPIRQRREPESGRPGIFFYVRDRAVMYGYDFSNSTLENGADSVEVGMGGPGRLTSSSPGVGPVGRVVSVEPHRPETARARPVPEGRSLDPSSTAPHPTEPPPECGAIAAPPFPELVLWLYAQAELVADDPISPRVSVDEVERALAGLRSSDRQIAKRMLSGLWEKSRPKRRRRTSRIRRSNARWPVVPSRRIFAPSTVRPPRRRCTAPPLPRWRSRGWKGFPEEGGQPRSVSGAPRPGSGC